ncbi:MAG: hypothetical protein OXC02_03030 [Rhodobacteraceae bacterium]|nr:hypothetical protein [Paracoccaceae bacterium]
MEQRNLFKEDRLREALAEFNTFSRMKDLEDWDRFKPTMKEVFGRLVTSVGQSFVRSYDHVSCSFIRRHVFPERPPVAIYVAGPNLLQADCGSSEHGPGSGVTTGCIFPQ